MTVFIHRNPRDGPQYKVMVTIELSRSGLVVIIEFATPLATHGDATLSLDKEWLIKQLARHEFMVGPYSRELEKAERAYLDAKRAL